MDDDVDRHVTCHPSVRREQEERHREAEAREAAEGVVQTPRCRVGRTSRVVVEDEPQFQADPDYMQMDVEHQTEDDAEANYMVILDDTMIFRTTKEARDLIEGSEREQYGLLWDYANEPIRSNPNSTVRINTIPMPESPPQFLRFSICLKM
ncbi:hypothetical protein MTR_7g013570 [Medicago truncatula]|uniref:Uncharacterized protein n=1 Tax=Medicago truncatula TaxID=3880 RepID=G7L643_MEDTR|nr:hypothetical protein MTR_7g013570 [Medicago truncatula]